MKRRALLQAGAAAATVPLLACGSPGPETAAAPSPPPPSPPPPATPPGTPPAAAAPPSPPAAAPPGEPSPPAPPPPPFELARVIARVGKNHGHLFTVALADVLAGAEKTYDLTGSSHPHAVTLSPDHMTTLRTGAILRVKSSLDSNHAHRLWVRCAPPTDPPEWVTACKASFTGKDEHELVIPVADLASTADRTYDVQGIAGHAHSLTLTAANFETLRKGGPVTTHTSRLEDDAHMHQVTVEVLRKG
jgi:hypothetical protein